MQVFKSSEGKWKLTVVENHRSVARLALATPTIRGHLHTS